MFENKNILVTGGTGFLGSYLCKRLSTMGVNSIVVPTTEIRDETTLKKMGVPFDKIHLVKGDITDMYFLRQIFSEYEFDIVFHLAAISEVRKCQQDPELAFNVNVQGTINVLEVCRMYKDIQAIAISSSDKAYGRHEVLPYKEQDGLFGSAVYEVTKSCVDLIARSYADNFYLPVVVTRCSNLFGPLDKNTSRIIPNTINKVMAGESPIIWNGCQGATREFLYIEDAVDAYLSLVRNIAVTRGNAYNVGSGDYATIQEIVELIISKIDPTIKIEYPDKGFPEITHQYLDSSKIRNEIGWEPKVSLNQGIDMVIEFYKVRNR